MDEYHETRDAGDCVAVVLSYHPEEKFTSLLYFDKETGKVVKLVHIYSQIEKELVGKYKYEMIDQAEYIDRELPDGRRLQYEITYDEENKTLIMIMIEKK